MVTTNKPVCALSKNAQEAIVDQLRACHTSEEIIVFEKWFNAEANAGPLVLVICDFLRSRSISRGLAAKWLSVLFENNYK